MKSEIKIELSPLRFGGMLLLGSILLSLLFLNNSFGQARGTHAGQVYIPNNLLNSGMAVKEKKVAISEMPNHFYWFSDSEKGKIWLKSGDSIVNVLLNLDLVNEKFEIQHKNKVYEVDFGNVLQFEVLNHQNKWTTFNNGSFLNFEGTPIIGFIETIVDGEVQLLRSVSIIESRANYNEALNVGSTSNKMVKEFNYFYSFNGTVTALPKGGKKRMRLLKKRFTNFWSENENYFAGLGKEVNLIRFFGGLNDG